MNSKQVEAISSIEDTFIIPEDMRIVKAAMKRYYFTDLSTGQNVLQARMYFKC
jgi:hypothetical protein